MSRYAIVAWLGLLVALFSLRIIYLTEAGPYVRHMDEKAVAEAAGKIVDSGNVEPTFYGYPSLPIYLSALGFATGSLFDPAPTAARPPPDQVSYFPTYWPANRGFVARSLFCLLGTLAVAFASLTVARVARDSDALVVAPLVAVTSPLLARHTWEYLNVDIVGACFATASLLVCCTQPRDQLSWWRTATAGLSCGLAIGSKYPLGLAIVPCALIVLLATEVSYQHRMWHLVLLAVTLVAGFLIAVPYFIPHFDRYMAAIEAEARHYDSGHSGFTSEPGLEHLGVQLRALADEFSLLGVALGLLGGATLVHRSRRRGTALVVFPVLLLLYISMQRVNFQRNLLAPYVLFTAFMALGIVTLGRRLTRLIGAQLDRTRAAWAPAAVTATMVALYGASLPGSRIVEQLTAPNESRLEVIDWICAHVPKGATLIVPVHIFLADDRLRDDYRVVLVDFYRPSRALVVFDDNPGQYVVMPTFDFDRRWPKTGRLAAILTEKYSGRGQVLKTFGTNPVVVNYKLPVQAGNPALAVLKL